MYLYNVTVSVEKSLVQEWVDFMKNEHIPLVLGTDFFYDARIMKVLVDSEDGDVSYAVQYFAKSLKDVQDYLNNRAPEMRKHHGDKFGEKIAAFRTVLEEV